ncbi:MAG: TraR/DksA C4-type zinc finger protein [Betaproteobacteria bacterium]
MPLSKSQYDELKRAIDDRRAALTDEIRSDSARVREDSHGASAGALDRADVAATGQIVDMDNAELERDLNEMRELEAARARLDAGSFAQCIDCHKEIEYPRLRAQPMASRCLDCQRRFEASHAHSAVPKR